MTSDPVEDAARHFDEIAKRDRALEEKAEQLAHDFINRAKDEDYEDLLEVFQWADYFTRIAQVLTQASETNAQCRELLWDMADFWAKLQIDEANLEIDEAQADIFGHE